MRQTVHSPHCLAVFRPEWPAVDPVGPWDVCTTGDEEDGEEHSLWRFQASRITSHDKTPKHVT